MFIQLKHKSFDIYKTSRDLAKEVHKISPQLPREEKFNMISPIRLATLSVKLNLAEGSTRKSEIERKRFYEISTGSVVEIDAALERAVDLNYFTISNLDSLGILLNRGYAMLSKMIK